MRQFIIIIICISLRLIAFSQIEPNLSYSDPGRNGFAGFGINLGYDFKLNNPRFGLKPQLGYKYGKGYNDFTGTDKLNKKVEAHTTVYYRLVNNPKYNLIPNLGVNLRYSYWSKQMRPPLNKLPIRGDYSYVRGERFAVESISEAYSTKLEFLTPGFTAQIQNKFILSPKLDLNITPFMEVDYDGYQLVGGGYFGITYKTSTFNSKVTPYYTLPK